MKRLLTAAKSSIGLILLLTGVAIAQEPARQLVVSLPQGFFASFKIEIVQTTGRSKVEKSVDAYLPLDQQVFFDSDIIHRVITDQAGTLVFAYDLVITSDTSGRLFNVKARPVSRSFEGQLRARVDQSLSRATTIPTLTRQTSEQLIKTGDTLAIDLLVNGRDGSKLVDFISIATEMSALIEKLPPQPPRDFEIANVELKLKDYQLHINEQRVIGLEGRHNCAGPLVWLYVAGVGRFIFSLTSHDGYDFKKVATIENNRISFTWKGSRYEWISRDSIIDGGGVWNLWLLHDEKYLEALGSPVTGEERKPRKTGKLYPDPIGILVWPPRKADNASLKKTEDRVIELRVLIGSAKSIEALLPNR